MKTLPIRLSSLVAALLLAACGQSNESELKQWMGEVRAGMKPTTEPVPPPKEFVPAVYDARATVEPFDSQKVVMAVVRQQQARVSASSIRPDLDRRRETLEAFPLDQIKMVGMMRRSGVNVALVETSGGTHLVRSGNYMGQNFGLVTRVAETEIQLKEIVQDAAGEWVERTSKLELQEAPLSGKGGKR
jgi:type IV pilus assembly protein PilP